MKVQNNESNKSNFENPQKRYYCIQSNYFNTSRKYKSLFLMFLRFCTFFLHIHNFQLRYDLFQETVLSKQL